MLQPLADMSKFSINDLVDAYWMIHVGNVETPDWKKDQIEAKQRIYNELLNRDKEELLKVYLEEVISNNR